MKATEALESVTTANLKDLANGQCKLTMFVDQETGGILDDLIITRTGPNDFYVVTNAGCRDQDSAIFLDLQSEFGINVEFLNKNGLLAIQGPKSAGILQKTFPEMKFKELFFMNSTTNVNKWNNQKVSGIRVTRCGYTGEDGFEVSLPEDICEPFLKDLMAKNSELRFAGLGARDTLRLEAGLCLYGSDMDKTTTPREAVLNWLVDKRRIQEKTLPAAILSPEGALPRKRIGFLIESSETGTAKAQPIPRAGMEITRSNGEVVGKVTSGALSPSLTEVKKRQISVGMGYIHFKSEAMAKEFKFGTEIGIKIRNNLVKATVSKMPFVQSNYYVKK